jgi:zinc and cadmium transporter
LTAVAIALHEIPQEVGDFIILLNAGFSKAKALLYNFISSMMAVLGGVLGYFFLDSAEALIPYVIVLASSSFIYIAVSDLMPQMHRRPKLKESMEQISLIVLGVILVLLISELSHLGHSH